MVKIGQVQLGKQGVTDNFIDTLQDHFKNHENVKVSVLKSAGHDKKKVKEFSDQILDLLGKNYTSRIVGFTISLKKWRRDVR